MVKLISELVGPSIMIIQSNPIATSISLLLPSLLTSSKVGQEGDRNSRLAFVAVNSNAFVILFKFSYLGVCSIYEADYLFLYSFSVITPEHS